MAGNIRTADDSFKKVFLDAHNSYRAQHSAPALSYSAELCNAAQKWAEQLLQTKELKRSEAKDGENIYSISNNVELTPTGKEAVDSWYNEIKDYDFGSPGLNDKTAFFTQVVWKESTDLGVGMASDGKFMIVVGQYRPAGNIPMNGYFEKNVLPKVSGATTDAPKDPADIGLVTPGLANIQIADDSFKKDFLDAHNSYRAKHSAPALSYSAELCDAAQEWASHLLEINTLKHSDTKDGENICHMFSSATVTPTGKKAVDMWYDEIKNYDFSSPGFFRNTGHFTQVVWKESTELGVGMATDGNRVFVVGQYRPAGNMVMPGYFEKNVHEA